MNCFLVDNMLGKLAKYLRMLGYNTKHPIPNNISELQELLNSSDCLLITRSEELNKKLNDEDVLYFSSQDFKKQLNLVYDKLNIEINRENLFKRCLLCNNKVERVPKSMIQDRLPPKVKSRINKFWICENCDKIYWRGGHTKRMIKKVTDILEINHIK